MVSAAVAASLCPEVVVRIEHLLQLLAWNASFLHPGLGDEVILRRSPSDLREDLLNQL